MNVYDWDNTIYRGDSTNEQLYAKIADTLTLLTTGGEKR